MRRAAATSFLFLTIFLLSAPSGPNALSSQSIRQVARSEAGGRFRNSCFTVHNIWPAHQITRGAGARIGVLAHSFDQNAHPELYGGWQTFVPNQKGERSPGSNHYGYWMSLAVKEVAPEAQVFALDIGSPAEGDRIQAMVQALEWAAMNGLDAVTYPGEAISEEGKEILDPAVEKALAAGVVPVFVNYPHPGAIRVNGIAPVEDPAAPQPDLNIFDYTQPLVFGQERMAFLSRGDDFPPGFRPYLSLSSTSAITAGFVALIRSMDPDLSPGKVKEILLASSHSMVIAGREGARVPDVAEAVSRIRMELVRR